MEQQSSSAQHLEFNKVCIVLFGPFYLMYKGFFKEGWLTLGAMLLVSVVGTLILPENIANWLPLSISVATAFEWNKYISKKTPQELLTGR